MKFKTNDIVYLKPFLIFDLEMYRIIKYDKKRNKYMVLVFDDLLNPEEKFTWTFVKEEDIILADQDTIDYYNDFLHGPFILDKRNYDPLYTWSFKTLKQVAAGERKKGEYFRALRKEYANIPYEDDFAEFPLEPYLYEYQK